MNLQISYTLTASQRSEKILENLMAHELEMLKLQHAHELALAQLRAVPAATVVTEKPVLLPPPSSKFSEEDEAFNTATSYGFGTPVHIGLIAKTRVTEGVVSMAQELMPRWIEALEDTNNPLPNLETRRLLSVFLAANAFGWRLARWPHARDATGILPVIKQEFTHKLKSMEPENIVKAYEAFKEFWGQLEVPAMPSFNTTLLAEELDRVFASTALVEVQSIKHSPFFVAFAEKFPDVSLDELELQFNGSKSRQDLETAGMLTLQKRYKKVPPPELAHVEEWPAVWHLHSKPYYEKWKIQLREIKSATILAQQEWQEAITKVKV